MHELVWILGGAAVGLALSVPTMWGVFALIERHDRNRIHRWEKQQARKAEKRG